MGSNPSWRVSIKSGDGAGIWTWRHAPSADCLTRRAGVPWETGVMLPQAEHHLGSQRLGEEGRSSFPCRLQGARPHPPPADALISDQQPIQLWQHIAVVLSHLVCGYLLWSSRARRVRCCLWSSNASDSMFSFISRSTMWLFQIYFFVFCVSCACIMASSLSCL